MKPWFREKEVTPTPLILSVLPDIFEYELPFLNRKALSLLFGIPALIIFLLLLFSCATDLLIPANARWNGFFVGMLPSVVGVIVWFTADPGEFLRVDHIGIGYRRGSDIRHQVIWDNVRTGVILQRKNTDGYIVFKSITLRGTHDDFLFAWAFPTNKYMPLDLEIVFIEYIQSKLPEERIRFE